MVAVMMECPALVTGCQRSISRSARDAKPHASTGVDGLDLVPTRSAAEAVLVVEETAARDA
jgi:hypothetical protein